MATVAELDVKIDAHDNATKQILALDALIKSLEKGAVDIEVDADTGEAEGDISHLIAEINSIGDEVINIEVDVDGAAEKIAELEAELKAIPDEKVTIEEDVDSDSVKRARLDMDKLDNAALSASRQVGWLAAAILGLGSALVPLGAVLGGGILALSGLLTTAIAGVGLFGLVAKTAFGGVTTALKKMSTLQQQYNAAVTDKQREAAQQKMKALLDSLSPSEAAMVKGVQDFNNAWRKFSQQFQPEIFQIATEGLKGITAILPSLAPIVQGTADAFLSLERSAVAALAGPFWQSFISMIGSQAGPLIASLGRSVGNVIKAFAAITMAFMPLTVDFTGGLENMTGALADWAANLSSTKGFRDFVAYVRENTPIVLSFLASFADVFVAIVKAAAPLGEMLLILTTKLFNAAAAFQKAHPHAATFALGLIGVLAVTLNLLGPLLSIGKLVTMLASGLGLLIDGLSGVAGAMGLALGPFIAIVAIIAAIIGALVYAYFHFDAFRDLVDRVASSLWGFAQTAGKAIMSALGALIDWLSATFGPAIQTVSDFAVQQFDKISQWVTDNKAVWIASWETIKSAVVDTWNIIGPLISRWLTDTLGIFQFVWPIIVGIVKGAWQIISGLIAGALDIIMGIILVFGGILQGDWGTIWRGIVQILRGVWEIIAGVVLGALTILQSILQAGVNAMWGVIFAFVGKLVAGWSAAWSTITSIAKAAWSAITAGAKAFQSGVQAIISAMWTAILAIFRAGISLMVAGLQSAWATIRSATSATWNFVASAVSNGASAAWRAVSNAFSNMVHAVGNAMSSIGRAISSGWSNVVGLVRQGVSNAAGAVSALAGRFYSAGASLMASLARGILSGIGNAVGAVRRAVDQLTSLLPGSPAKTGPLSGSGYALIRGQHLSEDLAAGMMARSGLISSAAQDIADLMSLDLNPSGAFAAMAGNAATAPAGAMITVEAGAVQVAVGDGVTTAEAKQAFSDAGDTLAEKLEMALRRQ